MNQFDVKKIKGFTLIELLLVIGIIGILSVIGLASFSGTIQKGRDTQRKNALSILSKALEAYKNEFGEYPDDDASGNIIACQKLVSSSVAACPTDSIDNKFAFFKGGEQIILLNNYPSDPTSGRSFRYEKTNASATTQESYVLYAALESISDKDLKKTTTTPAGADWGVSCGTVNCNYKISQNGLIQ